MTGAAGERHSVRPLPRDTRSVTWGLSRAASAEPLITYRVCHPPRAPNGPRADRPGGSLEAYDGAVPMTDVRCQRNSFGLRCRSGGHVRGRHHRRPTGNRAFGTGPRLPLRRCVASRCVCQHGPARRSSPTAGRCVRRALEGARCRAHRVQHRRDCRRHRRSPHCSRNREGRSARLQLWHTTRAGRRPASRLTRRPGRPARRQLPYVAAVLALFGWRRLGSPGCRGP